jgi:hypothetical protein
MIESIFSIFMGAALFVVGCHCLLAIPVAKLRKNWRGTKIKTGAVSNLGFSILFLQGAAVTLFLTEQFERFIDVFAFVVIPASLAIWLCFLGYKKDAERSSGASST